MKNTDRTQQILTVFLKFCQNLQNSAAETVSAVAEQFWHRLNAINMVGTDIWMVAV
jgi:hypothetical protein